MDTMDAPAYVFWDHNCRVCRASAAAVIWVSRRAKRDEARIAADTLIAAGSGLAIGALPFDDPRFVAWQPLVPEEVRTASMRVVEVKWNEDSGEWIASDSFGGGRAVIEVLRRLPGTRWLGRTIDHNRHLTSLTDRAYWLIARNRSHFARLVPNVWPDPLELDPPTTLD